MRNPIACNPPTDWSINPWVGGSLGWFPLFWEDKHTRQLLKNSFPTHRKGQPTIHQVQSGDKRENLLCAIMERGGSQQHWHHGKCELPKLFCCFPQVEPEDMISAMSRNRVLRHVLIAQGGEFSSYNLVLLSLECLSCHEDSLYYSGARRSHKVRWYCLVVVIW